MICYTHFFALLLSLSPIICMSQNKADVYNYIDSSGVKHPEIVKRQAMLETGYLKSYGFRHRNNLFGATNGRGKYLVFDSWQESVAWYIKWQNKYYKGGDYYAFLNCVFKWKGKCYRYAEDPLYTDKLKKLKL